VILAISLLLALQSLRVPRPRVAAYYGELQSAELVHAARLYWSNPALEMDRVLAALYEYNESLNLVLPPASYALGSSLHPGDSGYGYYRTEYNVSVVFHAYWEWELVGTYSKRIAGVETRLNNYSLYYYHSYSAPQWGSIVLYPGIWDPAGVADIRYLGEGRWYVGAPAGAPYPLEDEFGITIYVGG